VGENARLEEELAEELLVLQGLEHRSGKPRTEIDRLPATVV